MSDAHAAAQASPQQALEIINALASYIRFRYVGELDLALEELAQLGKLCNNSSFQHCQFWSQLKWVAESMGLSGHQYEQLAAQTE